MPAEVAEAAEKTTTPEIPDKLYFRIGEVSQLAGIKPYVLRFWESEFPGLGPKKSGTGHRLYRRKDVEMVFQIKRLLYDERYTIEGARKAIDHAPPRVEQADLFEKPPLIEEIRKELSEILQILS